MYISKINKIGISANDILEEDMMIIFYDDVPKDLQEISFMHKRIDCDFSIDVGDKIVIGDVEYNVIDVGEKAKETLKTLGHCTFKFDSNLKKVELPGQILLRGKRPQNIFEGIEFKIIKN